MMLREIRAALTALVLPLAEGAKIIRTDVPKPVVRPSFKIDVLPVSGGAACAGGGEREVDIDVWYCRRGKDRPRDECDAVAGRQFATSWVETAAEDGEPMETLAYNREEETE